MQLFILFCLILLFNCIFANYTTVLRTHNDVLSRKRRFIIFPSGSFLLITASMVKSFIITSPKGYNQVIELDMYFTLPDKVYHKNKKHKQPEPIPEPSPQPSTEATIAYHDNEYEHYEHDHQEHDFHHDHGEIWVPDSGWENNVKLESLSPGESPPAPNRRIWKSNNLKQIKASNHLSFPDFITKKDQSSKSTNYYPYLVNKPLSSKQKSKEYYVPQGRSFDSKPKATSKRSTKNFNYEDWDHYHGHKERRDIYENVLNTLSNHGFTLKDCILRSICESQHYLMPKGKSLIYDMFRVIFTMPIRHELTDPYSNAMRLNKYECYKKYSKNCPISLLEIFQHSDKLMANGLRS